MNREEAKKALDRGQRVRHRYFAKGCWVELYGSEEVVWDNSDTTKRDIFWRKWSEKEDWSIVDEDEYGDPDDDPTNPPHYEQGKIKCIDFIDDQDFPRHLANVIKYVTRARHKGNEKEDLQKARWYLDRHISKMK